MPYNNRNRISKKYAVKYRVIALINTLEKVFAQIINNRLKKRAERKSILLQGQDRFKIGRGHLDQLYTFVSTRQLKLRLRRKTFHVIILDFL